MGAGMIFRRIGGRVVMIGKRVKTVATVVVKTPVKAVKVKKKAIVKGGKIRRGMARNGFNSAEDVLSKMEDWANKGTSKSGNSNSPVNQTRALLAKMNKMPKGKK